MTPDEIIKNIIRKEGGFVDHPDDRGGPTNFGITQATLSNFRNIVADRVDVQSLTESEAHQIYMQEYVVGPDFLSLPERVQPVVVDAAVLHGPGNAIRMLQEASGAIIDGSLGPNTRKTVKASESRSLVNAMSVARLKFVANLVVKKPKQAVFLRGWVSRLTEFIQ